MIEYILNPQSVEALGWTLLHSLWQGAGFAILLVLLLIALRSYSAQSRYVVAVGLLCAFFLTVSATFWQQWQEANSQFKMTALSLNKQPADEILILNNAGSVLKSDRKSVLPFNNELLAKEQSDWLLTFKNYYEHHLPLLVTLWLLGILFLQLRFLGQLAYVQRLKHYGTELFPTTWNEKIEELEGKLRIQKKVNYLTSMRIESPMVIGWLKPVVLLPRQLLNSLSETEIYAILAHELAHIRREDFIINLMQTFLCNVFFFHPGVWWMSNRIDDEREHCCDDLAVSAVGGVTSYAKTLINISELQLRMQEKSAPAMALSGKSNKRERGGFSGRIRRLFTIRNSAGTFREGFATACILIAALFLGVVATGSTIQTTDSLTLSEFDKSEIITDRASLQNNELKQNTTITTRVEDRPISKVIPIADIIELPVAAPVESSVPVMPATLLRSNETRIDALVIACEEGDLDFVKTLVNSGIDVNGIGSEGFTPLMMAVREDETEIVGYLLKQGADVNQVYNGWTALLEAVDEGSVKSMKHLLEAGAKVNYYWTQDTTAIGMAASEGNLDCLQLLLDHGADINGFGNSIPPLHIAVAEDQRAIVDYLISQKVNINKKDVDGRTPLMYAASEGHKFMAKKLISAGADNSIVDLKSISDNTNAEVGEEHDLLDYSKTENSDKNNTRPEIHQATQDGLIEKVERMVKQGADVNMRDDYGRTPLHIASAENHNIDMRVLIDLGADINAQDNQGRTPLMYAAADGKRNAVALLVSKLANVNIEDVDGMRAYEWARSGGNSDLAKFLGLITENKKSRDKNENRRNHERIRNKQSLQKRVQNTVQKEMQKEPKKAIKDEMKKREEFHITPDGNHLRQYDIENKIPALLEAARNGSVNDCRKLLNNGLTANTTDDTGQTALMVAAMTNRLDIAKFLIEQGADVNGSSASGLTALHYTALENHDQMARLLLDNHAKVDATMRYSSTDGNYGKEPLVWEYIGATPLLIAVESQNIEVLSVLVKAGANKNHPLIRNEYRLNTERPSYLTGSEVMGLDKDFLNEVDIKISDNRWTPYKQALLLNDSAILRQIKMSVK